MPNGTGKTTTLAALRATLTGEARDWSQEHTRELGPKAATGKGAFEVRLRFDGRPLTIGMDLDFDSGSAAYTTAFDKGRNPKYSPPVGLYRFLERHFVNLIVFDGELPQALLNAKESRAEQAIEAFFQLYLLDEIADAVRDWTTALLRGV